MMIKIRRATPSDEDLIRNICDDAERQTPAETDTVIVADARTELAGVCAAEPAGVGTAVLNLLYVRADYMHKSIEERMTSCLIEVMKDKDIKEIIAGQDSAVPAVLKSAGFVQRDSEYILTL